MIATVWLFVIAIILTGWLILRYLLMARPPERFMPKRYRWLLLVSALLTASLWWIDNDEAYDSIWQTLAEIPVVGTLYCALFFFTFAGINKLAGLLSSK